MMVSGPSRSFFPTSARLLAVCGANLPCYRASTFHRWYFRELSHATERSVRSYPAVLQCAPVQQARRGEERSDRVASRTVRNWPSCVPRPPAIIRDSRCPSLSPRSQDEVTLHVVVRLGSVFAIRFISSLYSQSARLFSFQRAVNRLFTRLAHLVLHARMQVLLHLVNRISITQLCLIIHTARLLKVFLNGAPFSAHPRFRAARNVVAVSLQPFHDPECGLLSDGWRVHFRPRRQAWLPRHEAVFPEKWFRLWGAGGLGLKASQYRPSGNAPHTTRSGPLSMGVDGTAASIHATKQRRWTAACSIERSVRPSQLAKMQEEVGMTFRALLNTTHHAEASPTTTLRTCTRGTAPRRQLPTEQHACFARRSQQGGLAGTADGHRRIALRAHPDLEKDLGSPSPCDDNQAEKLGRTRRRR